MTNPNSPQSQPVPSGPSVKWVDVLLLLMLALLPLLFFWRLITPYPLDRMSIASGDFTEQYFPLRAFVAQQWVRHEIPLWNPYLYGGQPALADIQSGALYPIHVAQALILGWLPPLFGFELGFPLKALEWQVIFHFSIAAVGTYLFARNLFSQSNHPLRRARFGAVITSLTFTYSGYLTGFPVQQLTILEVSAWLPWLLWGLQVTFTALQPKGRAGSIIQPAPLFSATLSAVALAMAILAGHPQTALYLVYFSLAYTVVQLLINKEPQTNAPKKQQDVPLPDHRFRRAARQNWQYLLYWAFIMLLGAALAAAQILPTLEFIRYSVRAELSYQAVSAGLPLNEFVAILYPGFMGGSPQYVGLVALVLIALALLLARPRYDVYFWAGSGLVSLLLAFGGNLFVYPLFYLFVPGFDGIRQQERVFLIFSFSAAVLAGYGAIVLITPLSKAARTSYTRFEKRLRQVVLAAALLTALFIYGSAASTARGDAVNLFYGVLWHHLFGLLILSGLLVLLVLRRRRWFRRWWGMALLAIWLAFNLFSVNWRFNLSEPATPPPFTANGATQFLQASLTPPPGRIASGGYLPEGNSAAAVYNLEDITGNTPLHLANVDAFMQQLPAWRMWQLMHVRYVVDQRDISDDGLQLVFADETGIFVFEMGDPFERAWLVSEAEVIPEDDQAIARLAADDVNLRRKAVVPAPLPTTLADAGPASVTISEWGATSLRFRVDVTAPQLLVISQIFYPGWQVEIDQQPAQLLRVNSVLQGVVILPGQQEVVLTYWPASFQWGGIISVVALILSVVLLWFFRPTAHRQK